MPSTGAPAAWRDHLVLGAILLASAMLRLVDLGRESLWLDELSSVLVAQFPWDRLVRQLAGADVHPPLYFALLKAWGGVFGFGEAAARGLSVAVGVGSVGFAYLLARRLAGVPAGLVAAALVGSSPFAVYYAREARAYSLLLCLALAATWLLLRAAPRFGGTRLVAYAVVATLLPYTHVFGFFTLLGHALYVAVVARRDRAALVRGAVAFVLVALAFVPWIPYFLQQLRRVHDGFWIPAPEPLAWLRGWLWEGWMSVVWVAATVAVAALALHRLARRDPEGAVLVGAGVAAPTLVPIAISTVWQPIFLAKYAIAAAGMLLVAAAPAIASLGRRALPVCLVVCAVGVGESVRDVHLRTHKEQWRELAAFASRQALDEGIPIVTSVAYLPHLKVYLDPRAPLWRVRPDDVNGTGKTSLPRRLAEHGADRFWLLNVHPPWTDPELAPRLLGRYRPARRVSWHLAEAILWVDVRPRSGHPQGDRGGKR